MAVAFDARTGSLTLSYTHTPVGTPRGVLVEVTDFNQATDRVTGVTYGGVAMTEVTASPALHNSTEDGACHAFFLGSSIPTGAQTVVVSVTAGTPRSACRTYTASADTVVQDSDLVDSLATSGNITGTLSLGGKTCAVTECWFTSTGAVTGIAPLTNWTSARETDEGTGCTGEYDYDIVGTTDVTFGVNLTAAEDVIVLAVAITEAAAGAYTLDADSATYAYTATAAGVERGYLIDADAASYAYTATDATLTRDIPLDAASAAYLWTASDAALEYVPIGSTYTLDADGAAYLWSATDADLIYVQLQHYDLSAEASAFVWTASDAGLVYSGEAVNDNASKGGDVLPRRIKRETITPRGKTLRELFEASPRAPVAAPPEPVAPEPAPTPSVSRETFAPDASALIEGLESLRAAIDAAALAQALEEDDAEVLMVVA